MRQCHSGQNDEVNGILYLSRCKLRPLHYLSPRTNLSLLAVRSIGIATCHSLIGRNATSRRASWRKPEGTSHDSSICFPTDQRCGAHPGAKNPGADAARLAKSRACRPKSAETLIERNPTRAVRRPGEPRGVSPRVPRTSCRFPPNQRRGTYPGAKNPGADAARLARISPGRQKSAETLIGRNGRLVITDDCPIVGFPDYLSARIKALENAVQRPEPGVTP